MSTAPATVYPMWGIVFKIWMDEPVAHSVGETPMLTTCGRPVGLTTPCLPMKHALKFARPCKGCFSD